jgi:hypothetical protein
MPPDESVASGDEDVHGKESRIQNSGFRMEFRIAEHPDGIVPPIF